MSFANTIRSIRKEKGLSQVEISTMLGIKPSTLASYEEGRAFPRFNDLKKFVEVYEPSDLELFLFGDKLTSESVDQKVN